MVSDAVPEAVHVPRAVVAVVVASVVAGRVLTAPTGEPMAVVAGVAAVGFFAASALDPVRTHALYPTAVGASATALFGLWAATAADPRLPGLFGVAAAAATGVALSRTRARQGDDGTGTDPE